MNLYTSSLTKIGSLRNVGPATAKPIIDIKRKVFERELPPITTEHLAALPGARLDQRDWQVLLDNGTITLQIPEVTPEREPEQEPDPEIPKPMAGKVDMEQQGVLIGQMGTFGKPFSKRSPKT